MNMKVILGVIAAVLLAFWSFSVITGSSSGKLPIGEYGQVACTMEARLCPDGSAVGRTGPNCEFAACPTPATTTPAGATGTLAGVVTLSPICPVERMPPDPNCAPRGYAGEIEVLRSGAIFATTHSDAAGQFFFTLPPGTYAVRAVGGNPFPSCGGSAVSIVAGSRVQVELSCDTGIR